MPNRPDEEPTTASPEEHDIDQILAASFPASDAPPWTLGVAQASRRQSNEKKEPGNR